MPGALLPRGRLIRGCHFIDSKGVESKGKSAWVKNHPDALQTMAGLGDFYFDQGLSDKALSIYQGIFEKMEKHMGWGCEETTMRTNVVATLTQTGPL